MTDKKDFSARVDDALKTFYEQDEPIIDLTNPKIFTAACVIAVLLGFMIGLGYQIVFTSLDCINMPSGTLACFPNEYGNHKFTIFIVTLIAGILTGASPHIVRILHNEEKDDEPEDEE